MRGNKMGPEEKGPKTGRGLGFCNGYDNPGYMSNNAPQGMGRGVGRGRGRGFGGGFGRSYRQDVNPENSKLVSRIEELEKALKELSK